MRVCVCIYYVWITLNIGAFDDVGGEPGGWPLVLAERIIDGQTVGQHGLEIGVQRPRTLMRAPRAHALELTVSQQTEELVKERQCK